jgi:hypothetical protein
MIPDGDHQICPTCGEYRVADRAWLIPGEFDDDEPPVRLAKASGAQRRIGALRATGRGSAG